MPSRQITFTITDGTDPLEDVYLDVLTDNTEVVITSGQTDSDGELVVALPDGDYDIRLFKPGYAFTVPEDLEVAASASVTYAGAAVLTSPPDTPSLCRCYLDVVDFDGTPRVGARLTVENLHENPNASPVLIEEREDYASDSTGRFIVDLVQGSKVRISLGYTPFHRDITVPASATVDLATLLGDPQDSFTVVES